ncbi:ParB/RepB/Spo0J family partition protein [Microlunatus sp. Y2014]|uniref:ParB/RepB/Spo0J family partition protein n=1 Tax=Microlunatus sp. Y2014 TaxID=3418488 RepID=UPI003DA76245
MTELRDIAPADLHIGQNIRTQARAPRELVASIRARGVLLPIRAYADAEGQVVVIDGQLRTLAAREAGVATVPVMLTDAPEEADRLVDQWVANERRQSLTTRQKVDAAGQLALIGLTEGQIAKRTGTKKTEVAAALTAAKSDTSKEHADMLTLEQAAALAEFDDDPEAVAALMEAAERGQFEHRIARMQEDREEARQIAGTAAELEAQGVTVTQDWPSWDYRGSGPLSLNRLSADDGSPLDPETHTDCPGHAASLRVVSADVATGHDGATMAAWEAEELLHTEMEHRVQQWRDAGANPDDEPDDIDPAELGLTFARGREVQITWVCTQHATHADRHGGAGGRGSVADMDEAAREAARVERREVIENNKAWRAAETVRREWLAGFAQRKTAPKGAEYYVADYIVANHARKWAAAQLDHIDPDKLDTELESCTPKRATQIALVLALAAWEIETGVHTWRSPTRRDVETLTALSSWGYRLSDIEAQVTNTEEPCL